MGHLLFGHFMGALRGCVHSDFPWKAVWRAKVPMNISVFAWMAIFFFWGGGGEVLIMENSYQDMHSAGLFFF
jgi:hypothetical protein